MDPNTLNVDPDPGFWPNLDPDPGLCYKFWKNVLKTVKSIWIKMFFFKIDIKKTSKYWHWKKFLVSLFSEW